MAVCRCGFDEESSKEHPCHMNFYSCKKAGKKRFYNAKPAYLSGQQMKLSVMDTVACNEHWEQFVLQLNAKKKG